MRFFKSLKDIEERYYCLYSLGEMIARFLPNYEINLNKKRRSLAYQIDFDFECIDDIYPKWNNKNKHNFSAVLLWCKQNIEGSYIWYDQTIWFKKDKDLMFFLLRWS